MTMLRRLLLLTVLAGALVVGTSAAPAAACTCVPPEQDDHVGSADVIFSGTYRGVDGPEGLPSDGSPVSHRFSVDVVYKGEARSDEFVISNTDGSSCGYEFQTGRYVVYAFAEGDELRTGLCTGTSPLEPSAEPNGLGEGSAPIAGPGGGGGTAPPATNDDVQPIGGPDGDVIDEPSPLARLARLAGIASVAVALVGAAVLIAIRLNRRRQPVQP